MTEIEQTLMDAETLTVNEAKNVMLTVGVRVELLTGKSQVW